MFYKTVNLIWALWHWMRGLSVSRSEDVQQKKWIFVQDLVLVTFPFKTTLYSVPMHHKKQNKVAYFYHSSRSNCETRLCRFCWMLSEARISAGIVLWCRLRRIHHHVAAPNWTERGFGSVKNYCIWHQHYDIRSSLLKKKMDFSTTWNPRA